MRFKFTLPRKLAYKYADRFMKFDIHEESLLIFYDSKIQQLTFWHLLQNNPRFKEEENISLFLRKPENWSI